jgi:hypothetical protein
MPTINPNLVRASKGCNSNHVLSLINNDNLKREMNARNTITIKNEVYTRLRNHGKFGESFSILIARILDELERGKR